MSLDFFGNALGTIGSTGTGSSGLMGLGGTVGSWGGNTLGSNRLFGLSGSDFLGGGLQILGGFLNGRQQSGQSRRDRQVQRESMMAQRAGQREQVRAGFQNNQDEYARTIMRNRAAIAPWAQMYNGPRFTQADPNAPIYNPLSDPNHMFNQLGTPLTPPTTMQTPWNGG